MARKLKKKFIYIFLIFFIGIACCFSYFFLRKIQAFKAKDKKYNINIIMQKSKNGCLKSDYLAEIMELSYSKPTNFFLFDEKEAKKKLINNPFIKFAEVKKIKPSSVYVEYFLRSPIALIDDFKNLAIDEDKYVFPIRPFLKPKQLTKIYLNEPNLLNKKDWFLHPISSKKICLAFNLLNILKNIKNRSFNIKKIDVSNAFAKSLGQREIVLKLEHTFKKNGSLFILPRVIRIGTDNYEKQLGNYLVLSDQMIKDYKLQITKNHKSKTKFKKKYIDMRISNLAFIDEN